MKPGRELDALIAEKVMGWKEVNLNGSGIRPGCYNKHEFYPAYSSSIGAAWKVVLRLKELGISFEVKEFAQGGLHSGLILAQCFKDGGNLRENETIYYPQTRGETAPHAICLAALKAVGV